MGQILFNKSSEMDTGLVYDPGPRSYPRFHTPISPKENWMRAMKHQKPLWFPMRSDCVNFTPRCVPDNVARVFVNDGGPATSTSGGKDMFGIEWVYVPVARGSMVKPGMPALENIEDWEAVLTFPDIESWDWAGNAELSKAYLDSDRIKEAWIFTGYFERLISFMDFENAAVAMIDEDQKDEVHRLFQALTDLYLKIIQKHKQYFGIDSLFFHDDWGGQRSPFFSIATCREMLVPYFKQLVAFCHENDIIFHFHNCGKNELLLPAIVECGIDCWSGQPINDKLMLRDLYGDRLMIGISNPVTVDSSDAEIEEFAQYLMKTFWPTMAERPVYLDETRCVPKLRERLYELSRAAD